MGRQDMDKKEIKAYRPAWGNKGLWYMWWFSKVWCNKQFNLENIYKMRELKKLRVEFLKPEEEALELDVGQVSMGASL